ncbi:adenine phosphoribosyltransferase [Fervidobacterium sp. SC_NGM5_O18]|jgi:adenine phosphoribosyltransferase|uniref:Adenine phosphoribosyltransferase n=1 Tax=Fervidobacterium pennivorans TaxID=93466 RepID=A0A172T155_FERPE|nr:MULTISPECIES: adenine phosphoribosyltransferase [Fervidobacterium]ANE40696.1 adenine phosphoribosyltransferase [Fervidobacterium pennivorans]NPU88778.1 adenine phosphoribosyltransferase [Fervidobacterium sp.]PHJ13117.1 adenine phosphoribosyltransferase [Fervidobacterium sp. SC_NGM5_O18]
MDLKAFIRDIPDFPQKGVIFRDITPLIKNPDAFKYAIDTIVEEVKKYEFDLVVCPEARGFIIGAPIAYLLGKGFVPVRKPGKLPYKTVSDTYELEYGKAELHIHEDAIEPGQKVLIVDDVLATGGTALALKRLVEKVGGTVVASAFLIELTYLNPRNLLKDLPIIAPIKY